MRFYCDFFADGISIVKLSRRSKIYKIDKFKALRVLRVTTKIYQKIKFKIKTRTLDVPKIKPLIDINVLKKYNNSMNNNLSLNSSRSNFS